MKIGFVTLFLAFLGTAATTGLAMDRWSALSMLESADKDDVVGPGGEITRFQIQPQLWTGGNPHDAQLALAAAQDLMRPRLADFQHTHKRIATDFEFYVLWNAPAEVDHPKAAVADRARRYSNLVQQR